MIQAAATGVVDFTVADIFDRRWKLKLNLLLDYVARTNLQKIYQSKLAQHLAVLDYAADDNIFDHHWTHAQQLQQQLTATILPWIDTTPKSTEEVVAQMTQDYKEAFGDPKDPQVQQEMDRLLAYWQSQRQGAAT